MDKPLCIGHRGAMGYLPENTLPSFEYAVSLGCEYIEMDVHYVSGQLLVIHDEQVERTTNGRGRVTELDLDYLRSLDAGRGEQIPTLQEVIELAGHRCGINVELKGPGTAQPTSELLNDYCRRGWSKEDFLLSSFNHRELAMADPDYRRSLLFRKPTADQWERADRLHAWSVNHRLQYVTASLLHDAHERDYRLLVFTVNEAADIARMIDLGVDGIFSIYPDRILAARG